MDANTDTMVTAIALPILLYRRAKKQSACQLNEFYFDSCIELLSTMPAQNDSWT